MKFRFLSTVAVAVALSGCSVHGSIGNDGPSDANMQIRLLKGKPCDGFIKPALAAGGFAVADGQSGATTVGTNGDDLGEIFCDDKDGIIVEDVTGTKDDVGPLTQKMDAAFMAQRDGTKAPPAPTESPAAATSGAPTGAIFVDEAFKGSEADCEKQAKSALTAAGFPPADDASGPLILALSGKNLAEFFCNADAGFVVENVSGDSASVEDALKKIDTAYMTKGAAPASSP